MNSLFDVFLAMLYFFLWIIWLLLLFRVISDIFRDDDLGGGKKAAWLIGVIVFPFLGVIVYLIARGQGMGERENRQARQQEDMFRTYLQNTAAPQVSAADELEKLARLHSQGVLTSEEFRNAKTKILTA